MTKKQIAKYEVRRFTSKSQKAKMSTGLGKSYREWEEPLINHRVVEIATGKVLAIVGNSSLLCLPGGAVRAPEATDAQIIEAIVCDESVFA